MTDDIYCELLLPGHLPVEVLAETDRVLAFRHTLPAAPFHAVVIPKEHVRTLLDLESMDIVADILEVLRQLIERFDLEASAFRIVSNGGQHQESKHLHFHLLSPAEATERG